MESILREEFFSPSERVVVIIVTIISAVLVALLAGRLLLSVTTGAVTRRRGFQHDRIAEVEHAMRRPIWLAIAAAAVCVIVGLPGVELFSFGAGANSAPTFMRFVFYGLHHQAIGIDGIALLIALLVLASGFGAAYLWFNPARTRVVMARGEWPWRVVSEGFYVEQLTELATQPLLAIAGGVSGFDEQVTAPIAASVGESVDEAAGVLGAYRNARFARYLAGSVVVVAILALLSVLAATGHLWVHLT